MVAMNWFYTVTQSMIELGLSGTKLLVYAIVASFSRIGDGLYYGSRTDLCKMCGVNSERSIDRALHRLVKDGFIVRRTINKYGMHINAYSIPVEECHKDAAYLQEGEQLLQGGEHLLQGGCATFAHNNNNNNNSIRKYKSPPPKARARGCSVFLKPTVEEVIAYCDENSIFIDAQIFINFYEANGWMIGQVPMNDWRAAVRLWEERDKKYLPLNISNKQSSTNSKFQRMINTGKLINMLQNENE